MTGKRTTNTFIYIYSADKKNHESSCRPLSGLEGGPVRPFSPLKGGPVPPIEGGPVYSVGSLAQPPHVLYPRHLLRAQEVFLVSALKKGNGL